jgi:integrase
MARPVRAVPWLSQRDGHWYAYWYDTAERREKRLSLRTRDADEAQNRFSAFLTNRAVFTAGDKPRYTVAQALDAYREEHCTQKVIDQRRQENIILRLRGWFGDMAFSDIDIPKCREYADARRKGVVGGKKDTKDRKNGADSTIRRELNVLKAAANHAMRWRRLGPTASPPTPMPSIEMPVESRKDAEWLTEDEFKTVLRYAESDLYDYIMIQYHTAARRRSIERLTPFQVDLARNRINLRRPDETPLERNSRKRRPIVPIDPAIRPIIEQLMAKNGATGWLFGSHKNFYPRFRQLMIDLGMPEKGRPHILRHSRATHLLHQGVPLYAVAKLLGDTVGTVDRVYGHHCPDHLAATMSAATKDYGARPGD